MTCIPIATQTEAEAGTANDRMMTPLRTKQAFDVLGVSKAELASSSGAGMVGLGQTDLGIVAPVTPQQFGAAGDGTSDDGAALASALGDLAARTYPGGRIIFPGKEMNLGTTSYSMGDEVDLALGGTWLYASPATRLFSYGWGTSGGANQIARPRVTGGNIRLSGAGCTAFAFENCDSPLIRDTSIDLLAASQIGIHIKGLNNPNAPYYGVLDNVRVSGGSNPIPGDGRIGILFEGVAAPGAVAPNRWILSNLRHVTAVDYGIDIRASAGMVGNNLNLENCYEAAVRFGYGARSYTGVVTGIVAAGTGGIIVGGMIGTDFDAHGSLVVNTGANAGLSLPIFSFSASTGQILFPYGLPYAFSPGDSITFTEVKANCVNLSNVTYEGSAYGEDFAVFTAGARSCKVGTAFLTLATGRAFSREVEEMSNTIATRYETFFFEKVLGGSDGTEWLDPSHVASDAGGWAISEGNGWVDSVTITGSIRTPGSSNGIIEANAYANGISQGIKPVLTRLSPNFGTRIRKSLANDQMLKIGDQIKVMISKSDGLSVAERVRVAVRIGYMG